jgi:cytochrome oxidase Cu insertion factor (SCO1/SenC/PrrC family)
MQSVKLWIIIGLLAGFLANPVFSLDAPLYQAPMKWTDDTGNAVTLSKWRDKPVIITMAYSTCKRFCPMTIQRLREIQKLFDQRKIDAEFVIISYDPQNDTWQTWAEYRKNHHLERPNWHFLTGSPEDTKEVSVLLGMDYWLYDEHIMHNFNIVRLGPTGAIEKVLGWDDQDKVESLLP